LACNCLSLTFVFKRCLNFAIAVRLDTLLGSSVDARDTWKKWIIVLVVETEWMALVILYILSMLYFEQFLATLSPFLLFAVDSFPLCKCIIFSYSHSAQPCSHSSTKKLPEVGLPISI